MTELVAAKPVQVDAEKTLSDEDRAALRRAVLALERPSFAARLSQIAGIPLGFIGESLPALVRAAAARASGAALRTALRVALGTMRGERRDTSGRVHQALAALSGALGGAVGLPGLFVELPVSTTLMLRAIADIAAAEGEDLASPEAALACLEVFALGGREGGEGTSESTYFAVRGALARTIGEAARYVAGHKLLDEGAPAFVRLLAGIVQRFGVAVSQKAAAQAVPVIGALGGATVNAAFTAHFQTLARAHFTVRRLERAYGSETVRRAYERIRESLNVEGDGP